MIGEADSAAVSRHIQDATEGEYVSNSASEGGNSGSGQYLRADVVPTRSETRGIDENFEL